MVTRPGDIQAGFCLSGDLEDVMIASVLDFDAFELEGGLRSIGADRAGFPGFRVVNCHVLVFDVAVSYPALF